MVKERSSPCACASSSNLYWKPEHPPPSTRRRSTRPSGLTLRMRCGWERVEGGIEQREGVGKGEQGMRGVSRASEECVGVGKKGREVGEEGGEEGRGGQRGRGGGGARGGSGCRVRCRMPSPTSYGQGETRGGVSKGDTPRKGHREAEKMGGGKRAAGAATFAHRSVIWSAGLSPSTSTMPDMPLTCCIFGIAVRLGRNKAAARSHATSLAPKSRRLQARLVAEASPRAWPMAGAADAPNARASTTTEERPLMFDLMFRSLI